MPTLKDIGNGHQWPVICMMKIKNYLTDFLSAGNMVYFIYRRFTVAFDRRIPVSRLLSAGSIPSVAQRHVYPQWNLTVFSRRKYFDKEIFQNRQTFSVAGKIQKIKLRKCNRNDCSDLHPLCLLCRCCHKSRILREFGAE